MISLRATPPIDAFGVGTRVDTSADARISTASTKLQEYAGRPCRKRSEGKATWPGRKQVYRTFDQAGCIGDDLLTLHDDPQKGQPLLIPVLRNGRRLDLAKPLCASREYVKDQLARLPKRLRTLDQAAPFTVKVSDALQSLALTADEQSC